MGVAKFSAAKALPNRPARVMATCIVARNLAGCLVRYVSFFARIFPWAVRCFSFVSFIDMTAISALAKTAFNKISTICNIIAPIIMIKILLKLFLCLFHL